MKIGFELSLFFIFPTNFDFGIGLVAAMAEADTTWLSHTVLGRDFEPWSRPIM